MRFPPRSDRWSRALATLIPAAIAASACSSGGSTEVTSTLPATAIEQSIDRAIPLLQGLLPRADAATQVIAGNLAARYGIPELSGWSETGRARLEAGDAGIVTDPSDPSGSSALGQLFLRMFDPGAEIRPGAIEEIPHETENELIAWISGAALHCDTPAFPEEEWITEAEASLAEGRWGYLSTHTALGLVAMQERGCAQQWIPDLRDRTAGRISEELGEPRSPDDLNLERIAVLVELGARPLVQDGWLGKVLEGQQQDGGWPREAPGEPSDWHSTLLGVWVLSAWRGPRSDHPVLVTT